MAGFLSLFESLAPAVLALYQKYEPTVAAALQSLPADMSAAAVVIPTATSVATGVGPQVAMAKNAAAADLSMNGTVFQTICTQIGLAVAETATNFAANNPNATHTSLLAYLQSGPGYTAIENLVARVFTNQGLIVPPTLTHTLCTMTHIGIEMYIAGLGAQAVVIAPANA